MTSRGLTRDRVCFVHVGTHKTGTTAIQHFLAANRKLLGDGGLYYPRSGWLSPDLPGHHNVAFELAGDASFDPALGSLADVVGEFAAAGMPRVCLSSENFEYLHVREDALLALRDAIAAAGYRPQIVAYVRSQDEYAESLFAELVKHGMLATFDSFLADVAEHGLVRYDQAWAFRFDYAKLLDPFAAVFGADAMIVRGYRNDAAPESLIQDFLDTVGGVERSSAATGAATRSSENRRLTTGGVIEHIFHNTGTWLGDERLTAAGVELVARHPLAAGEPFRPLEPGERTRIRARFASQNAAVARRWPSAASITRPGSATGFEPQRARAARHLFERAEDMRRAYVAAASRPAGVAL
jgi:hypothetical protein